MAEKHPIPRHLIESALGFLASLKGELEDGLTEKGFISNHYLEEKLADFNRDARCILGSHTQEVQSPTSGA